MMVRLCNRCGKRLSGKNYTKLEAASYTKEGALRKEYRYDLCEECFSLFEKFVELDGEGENNTEYIEREAVIKKLNEAPAYFDSGDIRYGIDIATQQVIEQPTADVAEVRHGQWEPYEQPFGVGYSIPNYKPTHCCSNCKGLGWEFYTVCPHCGAKIDGKGECK